LKRSKVLSLWLCLQLNISSALSRTEKRRRRRRRSSDDFLPATVAMVMRKMKMVAMVTTIVNWWSPRGGGMKIGEIAADMAGCRRLVHDKAADISTTRTKTSRHWRATDDSLKTNKNNLDLMVVTSRTANWRPLDSWSRSTLVLWLNNKYLCANFVIHD